MKYNFKLFFTLALFCSLEMSAQQQANKLVPFAGQTQAGHLDGHALNLAQFEQPMGLVASPDGVLYLADLKSTSLRQIKKGTVTTVPETGCATSDIAIDPTGNLYLLQTQCHRILKLTTTGNLEIFAGTSVPSLSPDGSVAAKSSLFGPLGIAWNNGRIYFTEHASKSIRFIDEQGLLQTLDIQPETPEVKSLEVPKGIAFASDGTLYIADPGTNRVQKVDRNGIMSNYAGDGFGCPKEEERLEDISLRTPVDVAVSPGGKVYIAEASRTHPLIETDPITRRIKRVELAIPLDYSIGEMYPGGLAVALDNTVYLSGQNTFQVYQYTPKSEVIAREQDPNKLSVKVSPNPAYQNFLVSIAPALAHPGTLQVVNIQGQLISEMKLDIGAHQVQMSLPMLHSGNYHVIVKSGSQIASASLILQNGN